MQIHENVIKMQMQKQLKFKMSQQHHNSCILTTLSNIYVTLGVDLIKIRNPVGKSSNGF